MKSLLCIIAIVISSSATAVAQVDYLEKAKSTRGKIKTYHFEVVQVQESKKEKLEIKSSLKTKVWFNGQSFRQDVEQSVNQQGSYKGRIIYCTDCEGSKKRTLVCMQGSEGVSPVNWLNDGDQYASHNPHYFDWKYAGFGHERFKTDQFMPAFQFIDLFTSSMCTNKIENEMIQFKKVIAERRLTLELWISTIHFNPVLMKSYNETGLESAITTITYAPSNNIENFYYPTKYETRSKSSSSSSVLTVDFINTEINQHIPESIFQLKGMDLINGTPVELIGSKRKFTPTMQDGHVDQTITMEDNSLLASAKSGKNLPVADIPKPSLIFQAWPYFLGFVVFAVLGFWLLRKQRQAAKEG